MNTIYSILLTLLIVFPWNKPSGDVVLAEGIYTNTGYGINDKEEVINGKMSTSFYAKIYETKLLKTMSVIGNPQPQTMEYKYIGSTEDGYRIYELNQYSSFLVDDNYDIIEVFAMPSTKYGTNVWDHTYWEVVKGDREAEYNQKHRNDGSSYDSEFDPYRLPPIDPIMDY